MSAESVEKNKWTTGAIFVTLSGRLTNTSTDCTLDCVPDAGTVEGYVAIPLGGTVKDGPSFPRNTHLLPT